MNLTACITKILAQFQKGDYFDSHTVINELLKNKGYHLAYLQGYSASNATEVYQYHSDIAKMIGASGLATKTGTVKTHTIYGNLSENALWQRN
jgi:hypothetical protein